MKKRIFTVFYDEDSMELCDVTYGKDFQLETKLGRADVLKDAVAFIKDAYNTSLTEWEKDLEKMAEYRDKTPEKDRTIRGMIQYATE